MENSPYDYEYEEPGSHHRARYSPRYGQAGAPGGRSPRNGSRNNRREEDCRREARSAADARMRAQEGRSNTYRDPYGPRSNPARVRRIDPYAYLDSYSSSRSRYDDFEHDRYDSFGRSRREGGQDRTDPRRNRNAAAGRRASDDRRTQGRGRDTYRRYRAAGRRDAVRGNAPHARPGHRRSAQERFDKIDQSLGSVISARVIVGILTVLLVIAAISVVGRFISNGQQAEGTYVTDSIRKIHTIAESSKLSEEEVTAKLQGIGVEDTWAEKAAALSQTDPRFQKIAESSEKIGDAGAEVSNKLLKLAVSDPEAIDYVVGFASNYPKERAESYNDSVKQGTVPVLYQWDKRWGYTEYSSAAFGCTGCGPTAMSMVYMGLIGENDMSPADMAEYANANGFETEEQGTMNAFFEAAAGSFGMAYEELDVEGNALVEALEGNKLVICNVGPGDFTDDGHFIVLTGLDGDGNLKVNDPFSSVNSKKTWDVDDIIVQTKALYAFGA